MHIGLSPLQSGSNFEATIQDCERAEALGFDSVWLGEHHNHPLLYPTPLIGLAAIASRTRRVHLGTGVLLLPLYHPLAVAEEGAMVDMISGGRLILGLGAGYAPEEFSAFGISIKERGRRLEEGAALLHRLWTETARVPCGAILPGHRCHPRAAAPAAAAATHVVCWLGRTCHSPCRSLGRCVAWRPISAAG